MKTQSITMDLAGKNALVTGGTTGIGRATAIALVEAGCRVFICGRDESHLADALEEITRAGGDASGIAVDLADEGAAEQLFTAADEWLGTLDIAVLNAGIGVHGKLTDMSHASCRDVVCANLLGYISCAKEAIQWMSGNGGDIVMTGSMSAHVFDEEAAVYTATKSGIAGFATSLRKEANPLGIRIGFIEPGLVGTDMVDEEPAEQRKQEAAMEMLKAEDIARCILFMLQQPKGCDIVSLQVRPHLQLI
jgi:NAD(P)-dependent dehydrogenase (short-subunit alcohol dehydrogenase family)